MKNIVILALLCGVSLPGTVQAQQATTGTDDVVVMRRVITRANTRPAAPAAFQNVPTAAEPKATTYPLPGNVVVIDTTSRVECHNGQGEQAPASSCASAPLPASIGLISVPAKANAALHTISISRAELVSKAPTLENVDALCSSRITVDGQTWRLTCDDAEISGDYVRVPTYASPVSIADVADGRLTFNTDNGSTRCIDMATGQTAQSCPSTAKAAQGLGIIKASARTEPLLQVAVIDPNDLLAQAPTLGASGLQSLCTGGTVSIGGKGWKIRCDAEALRVHYRRKATRATLQVPTLGQSSTGLAPYQGAASFSTNGGGVQCIDTDTNALAVDGGACDFLPATDGVGTVTVAATYATGYRTLIFNPADVLAKSPDVTNMAEQCAQAQTFRVTGGPGEYWSVRCDASLVSGRYAKVAKLATPASYYYAYDRSGRTKFVQTSAGQPSFQDSFDVLTTTGVICRDTQSNSEVAASFCSNLANPAGIGTLPQATTFAPDFRLALIDPAKIQAIAPEASTTALCAGQTFSFRLQDFYGSESWKTTCDPAEIVNHYKRVSTTGTLLSKYYMYGGYSDISYQAGKVLDDQIEFSTTAGGVVCMDTNTGQPVSAAQAGKCDYLVNQDGYGTYHVPAKLAFDLRKIYFDRAAVLAQSKSITNVDAMCNQDLQIRIYQGGTTYQTWRTSCDANSVRLHYAKVPTTARVSGFVFGYSDNGTQTRQVNLNTTDAVLCRDTDPSANGATVDASNCQYMANPASVNASIAITAQLNFTLQYAYINPADVRAKVPEITDASMATLCNSSYTSRSASGSTIDKTFKFRCTSEAIRNHYSYEVGSAAANYGLTSLPYPTTDAAPVEAPVEFYNTSYTCIDTDTTKASADPTMCQYMPNPAVKTITATFHPAYRKVLINAQKARDAFPYGTLADNQICNRNLTVYTRGVRDSSYDETWTTTCDANENLNPNHRNAITSPNVNTQPVMNRVIKTGADFDATLQLVANSSIYWSCISTETGQIVGPGVVGPCAYKSTPTTAEQSSRPVAATFSPGAAANVAGKVYISLADIQKAYPDATAATVAKYITTTGSKNFTLQGTDGTKTYNVFYK